MPHSLTTPPRTVNIAEYLFTRLRQLGCLSCHGLPGDFSLRMLDFVHSSGVQWVGNCNELNAGYAADAYARLNGLGALCTTFGVGELSAVNAVAGSYAERVPVVHIVGTPGRKSQREGMLLHHTVRFLFFFNLAVKKEILLLSSTNDLMISIYSSETAISASSRESIKKSQLRKPISSIRLLLLQKSIVCSPFVTKILNPCIFNYRRIWSIKLWMRVCWTFPLIRDRARVIPKRRSWRCRLCWRRFIRRDDRCFWLMGRRRGGG